MVYETMVLLPAVASGSLALKAAMLVWPVVVLRMAGELVTSLAIGALFWAVVSVAVLLPGTRSLAVERSC